MHEVCAQVSYGTDFIHCTSDSESTSADADPYPERQDVGSVPRMHVSII